MIQISAARKAAFRCIF